MSASKPIPPMSEGDILRFNEKIGGLTESGCRVWLGAHSSCNRPVFHLGGSNRYAHRIIWEINNGRIPERQCVCHSCDNPRCINIDHLFLGTLRDNHDDMVLKGRRASFAGVNNSNAKLCDMDVKLMRALHYQNGCSARQIGFRFGVHPVVALKAIKGETWSHVNYLLKG